MTYSVQVTVVARDTVIPIDYKDVTRIDLTERVLTVVLARRTKHCFNLRHVVDWVVEEND